MGEGSGHVLLSTNVLALWWAHWKVCQQGGSGLCLGYLGCSLDAVLCLNHRREERSLSVAFWALQVWPPVVRYHQTSKAGQQEPHH